MNKVYLYDGSFKSLISLILFLIQNDVEPSLIKNNNYTPNLFDEIITPKIDNNKKNIISKNILYTCYYAFLSDNNNKEMIIYDFLKNSFKYKNTIFYRRNIDSVNEIMKLQKKVSMENHRMKGFLRFKKMKNNFYYAKINPTNNIIFLLTKHFKERLKNEYFVIHDIKRNIYAFYDLHKVIYLKEENIKQLNLSIDNEEKFIEELWKTFFKTVSIKQRKNLRCQISHMPKKYWNLITEMEDKL